MPNNEHLNILMGGRGVWNKWRDANPNIVPDLRHANLRGKGLVGFNLRGAELYSASLRNANLRDANLNGARLRRANLSGAILEGADFERAHLHEAKLKGASLSYANFKEAELQHASLIGVYANETIFEKANLSGAILIEARLLRITLNDAILNEADLRRVVIRQLSAVGAKFWSANLSGIKLRGDFTNASFIGAKCDDTRWKFSALDGANFLESSLKNAYFFQSEMTWANLWGADLRGANFIRAGMFGADLREARLDKTRFESYTQTDCFEFELLHDQIGGAIYSDKASKVAEDPFIDMSDRALRARRNLLLSSIVCAARALGVNFKDGISIFQTQLTGVDNEKFNIALCLITLYFLWLFITLSWENFQRWKLRLTGTPASILPKSSPQNDVSDGELNKSDPTAYSDLIRVFDKFTDTLQTGKIESFTKEETLNIVNELKCNRPILAHFSKRFWAHQKYIVQRFFWLDMLLPIAFSAFSLLWMLIVIILG